MFISIEGQDYVGKSTQVGLLVERLEAEGYTTMRTRSPGGSPDAESVRDFMLSSKSASPELRLILAGLTRKLTTKVINDFLDETPTYNKVVVTDRWTTSGYAYQVAGEGVSVNKFHEANADVRVPDMEIRLVMTAAERAKRKASMESVNRDVMEVAESERNFAKRVQNVFSDGNSPYAKETRYVRVFLCDSPKDVHENVWAAVKELLTR